MIKNKKQIEYFILFQYKNLNELIYNSINIPNNKKIKKTLIN